MTTFLELNPSFMRDDTFACDESITELTECASKRL